MDACSKSEPTDDGFYVLRHLSGPIDAYGILDPMPPGSSNWNYKLRFAEAIPGIARIELSKLPLAAKEFLILLTPGGVLLFFLSIRASFHKRREQPVNFRMGVVIGLGLFAWFSLMHVGVY